MASRDWTRLEVEAAVQDYLEMLFLGHRDEPYSKAEHNRRLRERLDGRSRGSVEFKHQNISAVLDGMGLPYIPGYKPRGNVQMLLRDVVRERIQPYIDWLSNDIARKQEPIAVPDVLRIHVEPPKRDLIVGETRADYGISGQGGLKPVNYVEQEARNQSLGDAGEALIMEYERVRLENAGKDHLARNVEQVSKTQGDHMGYDIRSYEETGRDRFVEVKTTRYDKRTPFYISANELKFCKANSNAYQLYRVFGFRKSPKLFTLPGDVETHVSLRAINYRAHF